MALYILLPCCTIEISLPGQSYKWAGRSEMFNSHIKNISTWHFAHKLCKPERLFCWLEMCGRLPSSLKQGIHQTSLTGRWYVTIVHLQSSPIGRGWHRNRSSSGWCRVALELTVPSAERMSNLCEGGRSCSRVVIVNEAIMKVYQLRKIPSRNIQNRQTWMDVQT